MGGDFTGCTSIRKKSSSDELSYSRGSGSNGSGCSSGSKQNDNNSRRTTDNNSAGLMVHHYKDPLKTYKIVILGDGGVGKSGNSLSLTIMVNYPSIRLGRMR